MMRKFRPSPSVALSNEVIGLSPAEMARTIERMELYDSLTPAERALVQHYGLKQGYEAARLFYGRWNEAWEYAEMERQRLQKERWQNIRISWAWRR
jgi:hypothetical protein